MASFIDMLNQGLGAATGTPLGQFGINMMMQAGPQQGNPGGGVRMGNALAGMQQMQAQQQALEQQKMLRDYQMQTITMRSAEAKREEAQRNRLKQLVIDNPDMIQNPMMRAILGEFGDAPMAEQIGKLQPGPKVGAMPYESDFTLPTGEIQKQRLNPTTMQYEPVGQPYKPVALQSLEETKAQHGQQNQFKTADQKMEQARIDAQAVAQAAEADRAKAARMDAERKNQAAALKNLIGAKDLEAKYNGVTAQFDQNIAMVDDLLKDEGLDGNFGIYGQVPNYPGSDAANFATKLEQFRAKAGLTELTKLKEQGVSLTPVSNTDLLQATTSAINLSNKQSPEQARATLGKYRESLVTARDEAKNNYGQMNELYKINTDPPKPAAQNYPKPTTPEEYNALKPGTVYIDPDDGKPYRKP
jgi:hypothetical protein